MLHIGSHISSAGGFEAMGRHALLLHADTFGFFTRNPRGSRVKALDLEDMGRLQKLARERHFAQLVAHAPYTLNPCGAKDQVREFAKMAMEEDLRRLDYLPGNYYNFHPGSHVGQGVEAGIQKIADLLNQVLREDQQTTSAFGDHGRQGQRGGKNLRRTAGNLGPGAWESSHGSLPGYLPCVGRRVRHCESFGSSAGCL